MSELSASSIRHIETACLSCGKGLDAAAQIGAGMPSPSEGDVTVCLYCRHVMIYNADLSLRNPTDAEVVEIAGDPRLVATINLLGAYQKEKELETRRRENGPRAGDEEISRQIRRAARRAAVALFKAKSSKVSRLER